ncbi:glucose-6-phosphate dehydrogenase [Paenibacillus macquariensis]|uniref:Glucose-6-phosphate 1-dehydrogenase n=1 Tax=Paenibacillus macquariensis TaxID=948756 RepID=A0ABY1JP35_9BACL|nr:glucose-6-phosphate dehydrogenase [Paenibacillus macquariensis]MEC0092041.1 glucose-6-phosphate dehydrogenase [Paenibacillus macquariensis]OAB37387.1 glucose-6-phosphate dehydrogenase [Paenibacillus macquariensis subsp. macquariensis]SIQ52164.1 glucose-6-phosphate 1-dehydrogenase [Paenibacillus macquariensis]
MDTMSFVLFGATGDLATRKIYPALYNLFIEMKMPESFSVIGLGRKEISNDIFQGLVEKSLNTFSRNSPDNADTMKAFLSAFRYSQLDVNRKEDYQKLLQLVVQREKELKLSENRMFYLSVSPEFFDVIALNINESGLGTTEGWKRLIIEKPFGRDLKSAQELNENLSKAFHEEEIFRIDHFLGKAMVQNLEVLESSNPYLQDLWSNHYIANVQITANETVGVEERAGYYDHAGALRDMFQNHMLQLLMMIATQLPKRGDASTDNLKKKAIMESLRPLQQEDVIHNVVRGQYVAGKSKGDSVVAYTDEPGVAVHTHTETFVAARLWIDDLFWNEVPFYIRTGKRMKEKSTRIVIEFKEPLTKQSIEEDGKMANLLVIEIGPKEGMFIQLNKKNNKGELEPVRIDCYSNEKDAPEAYEKLIHDAMNGDSTFFAHWDEVEMSWKWVQPILNAFNDNLIPLQMYEAGSYGPTGSDELLAFEGFKWLLDSTTWNSASTIKEEEYAYPTSRK